MSLNVEYASTAQCRPEQIWQVFQEIELWPRWNPQIIREVRWVSGAPWTKGAKFSVEMLKPRPFKLTPEVIEIDSPISVHLRGQGSGVTGEQYFIFKWMPELQITELRTLQEFKGGPIQLFGNSVKPVLEAGIKHLFARLTEEAEAIARSERKLGEPNTPGSEPKPPIGDPAPPPREPVPTPGEPTPPVGDPEPTPDDFHSHPRS
jgi:hypothetical protein